MYEWLSLCHSRQRTLNAQTLTSSLTTIQGLAAMENEVLSKIKSSPTHASNGNGRGEFGLLSIVVIRAIVLISEVAGLLGIQSRARLRYQFPRPSHLRPYRQALLQLQPHR